MANFCSNLETVSVEPDIQAIIDRWKLRLEQIGDSRYGVYAAVGKSDRILVMVWSEVVRLNAANDFIDLYLKETDPTLASQLLEDIGVLVNGLEDLDLYRFHDSD